MIKNKRIDEDFKNKEKNENTLIEDTLMFVNNNYDRDIFTKYK